MSPVFMLGVGSIAVILGVFFAIGNRKDPISRLMVVIGIVLIVLIMLNFSTLNHALLTWLSAYPPFHSLVQTK